MGGLTNGGSLPPICPQCAGQQTTQALQETRWQCTACGTQGAVCFYWRSHGASPGEWRDPADTLAIDLHMQAQAIGWESVWALRTVEVTQAEAEALAARLAWLAQYVRTATTQRPEDEDEGA